MRRLNNCLEKKEYTNTPIWFMRQAGRYLKEFREIRKNNSDFIKLCLNEKLVSEISLQPIKRFDIDAVILFSDILIIPYGLGQKVSFKKNFGPLLNNLDFDLIIKTNPENFINRVHKVYKSLSLLKKDMDYKNKSLIGFAGSPWTLLVYMLNKGSPKNNFDFNKLVDQERNKNRLYFIPEGIPLGKEWKETSMNNHELKKLKKKTLHETSPLKDENNNEHRPGTNISVRGEIEYNEFKSLLSA